MRDFLDNDMDPLRVFSHARRQELRMNARAAPSQRLALDQETP